MKLCKKNIEYFGKLTHDLSPIHMDPLYARRTQFGGPIVHGVACIFSALGQWANGRKFQLQSLDVDFRRPIFVGEEYEIKILESPELVTLRIQSNGIIHTNIKFTWKEYTSHRMGPITLTLDQEKSFKTISLTTPDQAVIANESKLYAIDSSLLAQFPEHLVLSADQMPFGQIQALAWASWVIGMRRPAQEALFSKLSFVFSASPPSVQTLCLTQLEIQEEKDYSLLEFRGSALGVKSFSLSAFERKKPLWIGLDEIQSLVSNSRGLEGKVTLVTGGARGLGAVLARAFALQGSTIILTALHDSQESAKILEEISSLGIKVIFFKGDIGSSGFCRLLRSTLLAQEKKLDFLILNAFPPAASNKTAAFDSNAITTYLSNAIPYVSEPLLHLLDLVKERGSILNISSSFVVKPDPSFVPYICAKAAVESIVKIYAAKDKSRKYLNLRVPRIATDQTNSIQNFEKTISPVTVAQRILIQESCFDALPGYEEINLSEEA
jgi:NAD(P)-dependent dehydrogenase (short-subunit alcohol dehydrogenase family)